MSSTIEQPEVLIKELESYQAEAAKTETTPTLHITDIHEKFKHLLTPEAVAALEPLVKSTLRVYTVENGDTVTYGPDCSRSIYLMATAHSPEGIEKAAKLIVEDVNKLAAAGVLRGHLAPLSMLTLSRRVMDLHEYVYPEEAKTYAVFCFPHVLLSWKPEGLTTESEEGSTAGVDVEPEKKATWPEPTHADNCFTCKMVAKVEKDMKESLASCKPEDPCFHEVCPNCKGGPGGT